ncbi:sensor histidine kinase RegB [Amylibacter marinus]|uniref:histidine kinase n=1 Tax=Amylibacter marinus TaxID=1475483 RepID=A0ABQ5VWH7_9RHOB|nr:ActS/PrrB/RegB family redox-sensitive histidine kinase [Amylibacter marinus]GLQ35620.1 sensor histidine kinase RegB [Amylibacter marinus]
MMYKSLSLANSSSRSEWVRLRTLTLLRWMAVSGQVLALVVAYAFLDIRINLALCLFAIGLSVGFNIVSGAVLTRIQRLSEPAAVFSLFFDLFQLVLLLYLTGGLTNPFALLLLAPVIISATALTLRSTVLLGASGILAITLLAKFNLPLTRLDGTVIILPDLLLWGNWFALVIGSVFLAIYARQITMETFNMSQALAATQMALDREHKLTILGGAMAATTHEMGTPLATIKLVASELQDELGARPELQEDVILIKDQAERLSGILRGMGKTGKDDLHMKRAPVLTVVQEAAAPHQDRGKTIIFLTNGLTDLALEARMPAIPRHPEIVHGLRNLIQNAVDFAASKVWVNIQWDRTYLHISIGDNGRGYPYEYLSRIGDPFLRRSKAKKNPDRPEYEGMGLGLFIAKTLLERTGAQLEFTNANSGKLDAGLSEHMAGRRGAVATVRWPLELLKDDQPSYKNNPKFNI